MINIRTLVFTFFDIGMGCVQMEEDIAKEINTLDQKEIREYQLLLSSTSKESFQELIQSINRLLTD